MKIKIILIFTFAILTYQSFADDKLSIESLNYLYLSKPSPNPIKDNFKLKIYFDPIIEYNTKRVKIFNMNGDELNSIKIDFDKIDFWSGFLKINLLSIDNGIYFIRIEHGNNVKFKKFIVQN